MSDFFSAVWENVLVIMEESPWLWDLCVISVGIYGLAFCVRMFMMLLLDGRDPSPGWLWDGLCSMGRWLKDKLIDVLAKFVPGETLYKWGLARLGKEYVECDTQDCSTCPFASSCKSPANAAGDIN